MAAAQQQENQRCATLAGQDFEGQTPTTKRTKGLTSIAICPVQPSYLLRRGRARRPTSKLRAPVISVISFEDTASSEIEIAMQQLRPRRARGFYRCEALHTASRVSRQHPTLPRGTRLEKAARSRRRHRTTQSCPDTHTSLRRTGGTSSGYRPKAFRTG